MAKNSNSCRTNKLPAPAGAKELKLKKDITATETIDLAQNMRDLQWDTEMLRMPSFDLEAVLAEDAYNQANSIGPDRFAYPMEVNLTMDNSGQWQTDADGNRYWLLEIESPGAGYMNIFAQDYYIPRGAKFVFYDETQTHITELTHDYHELHDFLVLWPGIPGDKISIEYHESSTQPGNGKLDIDSVIHDYTNSLDRGPFGESDACNIDVACEVANDWNYEEQSVVLILSTTVNGLGWCSGAMINSLNPNTQEGSPPAPYLLTANHCLSSNGIDENTQDNWTFVFNHESLTCDGDDSLASTNQTISGGTLLASNAASDFALLRLNFPDQNEWVSNWNVEFAGWDASGDDPALGVGIHHPSGDTKKICFEEDVPFKANHAGAAVWWISDWELGVTENGSSGSPLFNEDHRIIGQLYGGSAECIGDINNGLHDYYGRFDVTYPFIKDWLDPQGLLDPDKPKLDNWGTPYVPVGHDIAVTKIEGLSYLTCDATENPITITINNRGFQDINIENIELTHGIKEVDSDDYIENTETVINLSDLTTEEILESTVSTNVEPGENQQNSTTLKVTISEIDVDQLFGNYSNGSTYKFVAEVGLVPGLQDVDETDNSKEVSFIRNSESTTLEVSLTTDDHPEETFWYISNSQNHTIALPAEQLVNQTLHEETVCLPEGCYIFTIVDSEGNGLGPNGDLVLTLDGVVIYDLEDQTEENNFGYSEEINFCVDDTSISGCTDTNATNYNGAATIDDESCQYETGDLNSDGAVNVADIIVLVNDVLGVTECPEVNDLNEDGICNILDIVVLVNIILGTRDNEDTLYEDDIF